MTIICGVDISARWLDASIGRDGEHRRFARDSAAIAELAAFCRRHEVGLVVLEATGGYERLPFELLSAEGIPCALANPRQVRRFAEALGLLEKTDRIDAGVIAAFAAAVGLRPLPPASALQKRLQALTIRLRQLVAARTAQIAQRTLVEEPMVEASIARALALLDSEIAAFEAEIAALVEADPLWARLAEAFAAIKGVGPRTVATVLALLPEIGRLSNKQVAKIAGLAPIANDSGTRTGRRPVRGGRAPVRSLLVLIAGLVAKYEPDFSDMRERLRAAGKPAMVVRVALARKLLVRLNAKARDIRNACAPA